MPEEKEEDFATIRLRKDVKQRLDDYQDSVRRATGKKPPISKIIGSLLDEQEKASSSPESRGDNNPFAGLNDEDQLLLLKLATLIRDGESERLPMIRVSLNSVVPRRIDENPTRKSKATRKSA